MAQSTWRYSTVHNSSCKVIEEQSLWGQTVCRVWLPNQDAVVRVPLSSLRPLDVQLQPEIEAGRIAYVAAAAKVAEVLEGSASATDGHVLLAPMESNVIPLPHQIHALSRAISEDRVRYLLADEVGLGKTIEAGLVMRELKLRGLVRRTLVVSPKGIATQWVAEMQTHFNERFHLILGEDLHSLKRMSSGDHSGYWATTDKLEKLESSSGNGWQVFDQIIVSLDSVKPIDKRAGWSKEKIDEYNRGRFEDLITAGWDLIIIDEAHRLGGSTDQVARYKLGRGLAEAAPYVLLLSATPHQGKTDAFHRLMTLLDAKAFPDMQSVSRERVAPYVIRTEKRNAITAEGKPLFKPRRTEMVPICWQDRHHLQKLLYEAVTDYVRIGYNRAMIEKKHHFGFLMILMQRLMISSTKAIRTTLERRLAVLKHEKMQTSLLLEDIEVGGELMEDFDEIYDLDGQELLDSLLQMKVSALENESAEVETLLEAAKACEQSGPDAKAEELIELIYKLQAEENEPDLKVLIFTEFVPTQEMLREFLVARGISVAILNGSMDMEDRKNVQEEFRGSARVLVSTDAGGEGLNLQFSHVVINYDIPWNPMRLEQRIGRVDRIGQPKIVRAVNFVFEDSVEFRVREVLERKLSIILEEFGIDKTADVLDSAQAGALFEDMFASAILEDEDVEIAVDQTVTRLRDEIRNVKELSAIYGISDEPDAQAAERLRSHPLPHWVERMTVSYMTSHGGSAIRKRSWWDLTWPDGQKSRKSVFSSRDLERLSDATLLNLENNRVRGLALSLPQVATGQPIPVVSLENLPASVTGTWGLFEIRLQAGMSHRCQTLRIPMVRRAFVSVFLTDDDKLFLPTARHLWDVLQTTDPVIHEAVSQEESLTVFERMMETGEQAGREFFETLRHEHSAALAREEDRGAYYFESRRKAIERIGLSEVRQYRLSRCDMEEREWRVDLNFARQIVPEIRPLLMLRIGQEGQNG